MGYEFSNQITNIDQTILDRVAQVLLLWIITCRNSCLKTVFKILTSVKVNAGFFLLIPSPLGRTHSSYSNEHLLAHSWLNLKLILPADSCSCTLYVHAFFFTLCTNSQLGFRVFILPLLKNWADSWSVSTKAIQGSLNRCPREITAQLTF